jgi:hypothetical protein
LIGAEDEMPEVPLPNVSGPVLAKIMEFCTHHVEEPMNEIPKVRALSGKMSQKTGC